MNKGSCWPNGSYFLSNALGSNYISCVHSEAVNNNGGWILPSGSPCNTTTSPIQCNQNTEETAATNITLQIINYISVFESAAYKCCLPNDCNNGPTDIIIANIFGKHF